MWLFKPFLKWNLNPKMSNASFFDGWLNMFHKFLVCYVVLLSTEMKWAIIIISSHGCARHNYRALIVYFCCGLLEVAYCVHVMKRPCNIKTAEMYYRDCSRWNAVQCWRRSWATWFFNFSYQPVAGVDAWGRLNVSVCAGSFCETCRDRLPAERYSESTHITNTSHIASARYMRFIIDLEWFHSLVLIQMQIWSTRSKMKEEIHQDSMWVYITLELQLDRFDFNTEI